MRFRLLLISIVLIGISGVCRAQGVSMSPARIFFEGNERGDAPLSKIVTLRNNTNKPLSFRANVKDWNRDSIGQKVYFDPGTLLHSNADWVRVTPNYFTIAPNSTQDILVGLELPTEKKLGFSNSMLFFTQVEEESAQAESNLRLGIRVRMELGVHLFHYASDLPSGDLTFLNFEVHQGNQEDKNADITRSLAVKVKNIGGKSQDASLRFELTNLKTGEEIQLGSIPVVMFPSAEQWVFLPIKEKLAGKFLAIAIIDSGNLNDLKVAQKEIDL